MTAGLVQPSLQRRAKDFGSRNLVLSIPRHNPTGLQVPEIIGAPILGPSGGISFTRYVSTTSNNPPALVEIAADWVRLVLKQRPQTPRRVNVFDMAPLDLGRVLREPSGEDDLLEEMLDDSRF